MNGLGLRDKNGRELFKGDKVLVVLWDLSDFTGRVNYDSANACWRIDQERICDLGRDKGTTLEVLDAMEGIKPVKSRRKGKPS